MSQTGHRCKHRTWRLLSLTVSRTATAVRGLFNPYRTARSWAPAISAFCHTLAVKGDTSKTQSETSTDEFETTHLCSDLWMSTNSTSRCLRTRVLVLRRGRARSFSRLKSSVHSTSSTKPCSGERLSATMRICGVTGQPFGNSHTSSGIQ